VLKDNGFALPDAIIADALRTTKKRTGLRGRWDVVQRNPAVVLDVAHNEAGIRQLLAHLKHLSYEKLHLVIGVVKDKDIETVLRLLPLEATFYFTQAHIPRALDATLLQQKAQSFHLTGETYNDVNKALQQATRNALENDLIVVCGSIFLVAEVDIKQLHV
jgi:dihydrofolate synthase/folylpolyglutamate synthase